MYRARDCLLLLLLPPPIPIGCCINRRGTSCFPARLCRTRISSDSKIGWDWVGLEVDAAAAIDFNSIMWLVSNRLPDEHDECDDNDFPSNDPSSSSSSSFEEQEVSASDPVQYTSMCTVLGFFLIADADAETDCCDRIVLVGEMNGFTIGDTDLRMSYKATKHQHQKLRIQFTGLAIFTNRIKLGILYPSRWWRRK